MNDRVERRHIEYFTLMDHYKRVKRVMLTERERDMERGKKIVSVNYSAMKALKELSAKEKKATRQSDYHDFEKQERIDHYDFRLLLIWSSLMGAVAVIMSLLVLVLAVAACQQTLSIAPVGFACVRVITLIMNDGNVNVIVIVLMIIMIMIMIYMMVIIMMMMMFMIIIISYTKSHSPYVSDGSSPVRREQLPLVHFSSTSLLRPVSPQ